MIFLVGPRIFSTMVETVGRKLQKARQARQWTIDDVAGATKIRPERIVDLEGDDLSHFPSLVYARSFLVKYAKHLGVDIQDDLEQIPVGNAVGLREYNYLRATPPPRYQPEPPRRRAETTRSRIPPVLLAILALLILIGVATISFLAINLSRLSGGTSLADHVATETPSPGAKESPDQVASTNRSSNNQPSKEAASSTPVANLAVALPSASVTPSATREGTVEVRRALPVVPDDQSAQSSASPESTAIDTLEIRVRERTWLRVTKDRQNAEPIYNDFIGPRSPPIVIQGKRFWLRLPDKNALELRKNGQPVAGPDSSIVIESGG
jgi:cytoskeletal protein RodZ